MGLNDDEFGGLTLGLLDALLNRQVEREKREYLRAGIVAAAIYNANPFRGKNSKAVSPLDFVPSFGEVQKKAGIREQVQALTEIFGCGPSKPSKKKGRR